MVTRYDGLKSISSLLHTRIFVLAVSTAGSCPVMDTCLNIKEKTKEYLTIAVIKRELTKGPIQRKSRPQCSNFEKSDIFSQSCTPLSPKLW